MRILSNPSQLSGSNHFQDQFRKNTLEAFAYISNNSNVSSTYPWNQVSGTGFMCNKLLRSQKIDHGSDPTSLSRWTWAKFQGKRNTVI